MHTHVCVCAWTGKTDLKRIAGINNLVGKIKYKLNYAERMCSVSASTYVRFKWAQLNVTIGVLRTGAVLP